MLCSRPNLEHPLGFVQSLRHWNAYKTVSQSGLLPTWCTDELVAPHIGALLETEVRVHMVPGRTLAGCQNLTQWPCVFEVCYRSPPAVPIYVSKATNSRTEDLLVLNTDSGKITVLTFINLLRNVKIWLTDLFLIALVLRIMKLLGEINEASSKVTV